MRKILLIALIFTSLIGHGVAMTNGHQLRIKTINGENKPINIYPEPYGDFKTITVPIKRAGSLIIVEAQVDTIVGNFVLDTGAPGLVLNETYFRDYRHFDDTQSGGINGEAYAYNTVVDNLSILDLHYNHLTASVTNLAAIENSKGIKVLGLLGTRLFARLAITIDLFHNVLYIHKLNSNGEILAGERPFTKPDMITPFKLLSDVIFIKGTIADYSMWFAFDTGAECNLLDEGNFKKVAKQMRVLHQSTLLGIGHARYQNTFAVFDKMVIGNYVFTNNHVLITRLEEMGKAYNNSMDAVLGHDFFSRGIFTINFAKKELEMYIYTYSQN